MKNNIFDNFPTISDKEWKLQVQAELKGLDYNQTLVWGTRDDINVKPLYTKNDVAYENLQPLPRQAKDWKIIGEYNGNPRQDDSFLYGLTLTTQEAFQAKPADYLDLFIRYNAEEETDLEQLSNLPNLTYLDFDPMGYFAQNGLWNFNSREEIIKHTQEILQLDSLEKAISIQADIYQNAGANHVQQLALALLHGVEYLELFGEEIASKLYFKMAVGSNFFFEIAKLRAFRFLWQLITQQYGLDDYAFLFVENSHRNKSKLDIYNNVIRSTIEANSAILGGADAVYIHAYDYLTNDTAFGQEIAAKQQLLLKKESFMDQFTDPVAGSFYIENLTNQLAEKALELFKTLHNNGGFIAGLENNSIQDLVYSSDKKEKKDFFDGKISLIGVNKFRNPDEKKPTERKEKITKDALFIPIVPTRLAEEEERK